MLDSSISIVGSVVATIATITIIVEIGIKQRVVGLCFSASGGGSADVGVGDVVGGGNVGCGIVEMVTIAVVV